MSKRMSMVEQEAEKEKQNSVERKKQDLYLLSMKRPTLIDEIRARTFTPKNPMPVNALPEWKDRRLDSKFPAIPAPGGTFIISQGVLGEKLFIDKCRQEFDLRDPLIIETPIAYDALHDPSLREFFQNNPEICSRLVELGLVNNEGKVVCSLREFNKYRMYLSRIHNSDVAREKERMESWEKGEHEHVKQLKQYIDKEIKKQADEERRKRREKNLADIKARDKRIKLQELEHPCNYIKEKRTIEAKLRKIKRDALRKNVLNRIKRMHEADTRRTRHLILEWICKDEFREKLRNIMKLEKRVNREEDLAYFVDNKRNFQEKKLRYQRALLRHEKVETECKVVKRYDSYLRQRIEGDKRMIAMKEMMGKKAKRTYYLMEKYGHRWLAMTRKYSSSPLHTSAWHIRNILHAMVQYVRLESGAKSFTGFLRDILNLKSRKVEIDPETLSAVTSILDILVNRSYNEFIRRATSCLVDYVVDEARKKCLNQCYEEGIDPADLQSPIHIVRKREKILLPRPDFPCSGPCAEFRRGSEWPCSCAEELEWFHGQICMKLLRKLTKKMKGMTCTQENLENLETRVRKAKGSPFVKSAIDTIFGRVTKPICGRGVPHPKKHRKHVDRVANDLVSSVLGPTEPRESPKPTKARKGRRDESTQKTDTRKPRPEASTQSPNVDKPSATNTSIDSNSENEDGGVPIAPVQKEKKVRPPKKVNKGQDNEKPAVTNQATDAPPPTKTAKTGPGKPPPKKNQEIDAPVESHVEVAIDEPTLIDTTTEPESPNNEETGTDGPGEPTDNVTDMPRLSLVEQSTKGTPAQDKGTGEEKPQIAEATVGPPPQKKVDKVVSAQTGVNQGTYVRKPSQTDAGQQKKPSMTNQEVQPPSPVDQTTEPSPPEIPDVGNEPEEQGVDQSTQILPPFQTDQSNQEEVPTVDQTVQPSPPEDKGTDREPVPTKDGETQGRPSTVDKTVQPPRPKEQGSQKEPSKGVDGGSQEEKPTTTDQPSQPEPSEDKDTDTIPPAGEDKETQEKPTPIESSSQPEPPVEMGTDTREPEGTDVEIQEEPSTVEEETQPPPPEDKTVDTEPPKRESKMVQPPLSVDKGTSKKPSEVKHKESQGQPKTEDQGTVQEEIPTEETGEGPEEPRTTSTEPAPKSDGVDTGTRTDDTTVTEISETKSAEVVDTSTGTEPPPAKTTEPEPKEEVDEGTDGSQTVTAGTDIPEKERRDEESECTPAGSTDQGTGRVCEDKGVGKDRPLVCDESEGPPVDCRAWDNVEISPSDLSTVVSQNLNNLLCNLSTKMVQECVDCAGAQQGPVDPCEEITDYDLSRSISCHINNLLDNEVCLQGAEQVLRDNCQCLESQGAIDRCLEKSSKKLREACLKLPDCCDREKCLKEADELWAPRKPPTVICGDRQGSDEELTRTASGLVDCILAEQKSKLCKELAVVGSGDEKEITAILSDGNVSRISSAMVRDILCKQVCPGPVLEQARCQNPCVTSPSPAVKGSVRDKLDHIRSILDEVKADLAQVGIRHDMFHPPSTSKSAPVRQPDPESQPGPSRPYPKTPDKKDSKS